MDAERARAFLHTLPHVVETVQWGDNLVFWVGDKALGGKMFVLIDITRPTKVISYAAGPERFAELLEQEGLFPAPYMARIFWVAAETWAAHRDLAWQDELRHAHTLTYNKLPPKVRATLDLPAAARKRLIEDRKRLIAERQGALAARAADHPPPAPKVPSGKAPPASQHSKSKPAATRHRPKLHGT